MNEKRKLIDLSGLKQFLSDLKNWVKNYFDSRIDKEFSSESDNPIANSTITAHLSKAQWEGTKDQIEAAIESGDIIPGFTQVTIIDDQEDVIVYATTQDIYSLFGLVYTG